MVTKRKHKKAFCALLSYHALYDDNAVYAFDIEFIAHAK